MKRNVGNIDRFVRLLAGLAIGGAGIYYHSWWVVVGAVLLLTALIGWCPMYTLFKNMGCGGGCSCHK